MSAQNNTKQIMVSYGSPFSFSLGDNVTWEIKDEGGIVIFNGQGNVLVPGFEVPGHYKMTIHDNHTHDPGLCEHDHYPAEVDIEVKSAKLVFDLNTIKFSNEIRGNQSLNGIHLSVDVNFESYNGSIVKYDYGITSFGVGSSISGTLKSGEVMLTPGKNRLEFVLEGSAESGNNIQLNFVDLNGEVQPFILTPKF